MNTVTYQMSAAEVIRTGFRRKLLRPRFLTSLTLLLAVGVLLPLAGGSAIYVGIFCVAYAVWAPLQLYLAIQRLIGECSWFTAPTTLTFGDSGIAMTGSLHSGNSASASGSVRRIDRPESQNEEGIGFRKAVGWTPRSDISVIWKQTER